MTKTANSGASEANASNLSNSTGNTQEAPKSEATGHGEAKPSVREESWTTSDWLRELYTQDRCNVGTPWKQATAEFDRWLRTVKADAWREGHRAAWEASGDGWNGEVNGISSDYDELVRGGMFEDNPYESEEA